MFNYVLSSIINYKLLICNDAGPEYAASMGWVAVYLDDLNVPETATLIIDPRVQEVELTKLEQLVARHGGTKFLFRIADPYPDIYHQHYYYLFLKHLSRHLNVSLLSTYEAKGITLEIKELYPDRFLHLPYPYLKAKEVENKHKKNKIILSGSINGSIYPYRTAIWKKVTRSVTRLFFFDILRHPGYIENNSSQQHSHPFVKDQYINYISQFKYMLVCPSKFGLEFLKFNECAYAGCLPVGYAPDSYPACIKGLFLQLRPEHFISDIFKLFFKKHDRLAVSTLRNFLNEKRHPSVLNHQLIEFIQSH